MAITMMGTVTLKSFDARPLGQTGKGIQVEGTVTLQIPFSVSSNPGAYAYDRAHLIV